MNETARDAAPKPTEACQACKYRHRKCDWGRSGCQQCRNAGINCVRQPTLKFRFYPKQNALSDAPSGLWRPCPLPTAPVVFYDETPELRALYEGESPRPSEDAEGSLGPNASAESAPAGSVTSSQNAYPCLDDLTSVGRLMNETSPSTDYLMEDVPPSGENSSDEISPLSPREALLVRNFTDHMALWTDIADPLRTFETVVSQMAFTDLIIRYSICAFSARHFNRCRDEDGDGLALHYQNLCLNLLIPSMSGGQKITESVLTAVALLRQNEEMDEDDYRFHLEGTSRILNMVPEFSTLGGVAEAACWLCLREDIYVSLTTQTPIRTGLDCFPNSVSICRNDDYSWASRSILNLSFLLKRAFCEPRDASHVAISETEIAEWHASKPASYRPIYFRDRSRGEGRCFPEVLTLLPHHAVGLQYYHIDQIVLNAIGPRNVVHTHEYLAESRARERRIRHHLFMVLGLATSNERAENTWFTARHCLAVWGAYLHHPADQNAALEFLEKWRRRSGWKTSALIESLRQQWRENIEDD
ncbi:zn 2cys6 transcription factor [Colletotrichum camelliae]|nr:zn 2cys6 transcription factor [Colletotrichum camelliae]